MENLRTLHRLLPPDTGLVSGHGRNTDMNDLRKYIVMVEKTIEIVRKEMESGKSAEDMKREDVLREYGKWGTFFSLYNKRILD